MKLDDLRRAVEAHSGIFYCTKLGDVVTKEVRFHHEIGEPEEEVSGIPIESLADFYETFGALRLYYDPASGESAFYVGPPQEWDNFDEDLRVWFEDLSEQEAEELLPPWIDDCLVIGEIPASGNYLMVPLSGPKRGFVYEFEHDGFEFIELAPSIGQFISEVLDPGPDALRGMASHLRLAEPGERGVQWCISEMRDNRGNSIRIRD